MSLSVMWPKFSRLALLGLVAVAVQLAGCGSTPVEESPDTTAERLYKEAREDMAAGSYERAIKTLERVESLAAGSLLGQQAQLDTAYMHWRNGERTEGLAAVNRFIKLNPSSPALDYALYLRGVINFNENLGLLGKIANQDLSERDQSAARESFQSFKQLVDQFPQSRYAGDAKARMNFIINALASYEVHVARYYFRRGAYVAAAARAQQAVSEFQRSPAAEEALFLMMQSYDKLELTGLRDDAERVLRKNFPDSAFLNQGKALSARPWWRFW
ncbi:outer membrane protein assembly factor BamD [Rubrivivax rivuli]